MRLRKQRRVYATPPDGEGATARYDIEVVGVEAVTEPSAQEEIITSLGGRRAAARFLFALTFVPYFLPEEYQVRDLPGSPSGSAFHGLLSRSLPFYRRSLPPHISHISRLLTPSLSFGRGVPARLLQG